MSLKRAPFVRAIVVGRAICVVRGTIKPKVIMLRGLAAQLWPLIDGHRNQQEIESILVRQLESQSKPAIRNLLSRLRQHGLVK